MNRKNKKVTVWVAETALLLALLVVVQLLTFTIPKGLPLVSQFFTGTLVNMVLIVGTGSVGLSGTAVAAVASPLLAYAFGQMTFPQMLPVVAVGNLIIVVILWLFFRPSADAEAPGLCRSVLGIVVGAAVKSIFLWGMTVWLILPMFFAGKTKVAEKLSMMFSWPQAITAVVGGILALLVLPAIRTYRKRHN